MEKLNQIRRLYGILTKEGYSNVDAATRAVFHVFKFNSHVPQMNYDANNDPSYVMYGGCVLFFKENIICKEEFVKELPSLEQLRLERDELYQELADPNIPIAHVDRTTKRLREVNSEISGLIFESSVGEDEQEAEMDLAYNRLMADDFNAEEVIDQMTRKN